MFMIMGTFGIVVFILVIGFIGETISSMFSSTEESELQMSEESYSEYASA